MKRTLIASAILLGSFSLTPVFAQEAAAAAEDNDPLAAKNFTSTVYLTTNYMFRGISNSNGPAIQGSVDYTYKGFFVGAWGSNTEFSDSNFEVDAYAGYRWSMSGLDFTLQGIYYSYPGESDTRTEGFDPVGAKAAYGEVNIGVSHTFAGDLAPTVGANYFYSPDAFGEDGSSHTVQFNAGITMPAGIGLYTVVGYNLTEGDKSSGNAAPANTGLPDIGGYSYIYYQFGANYMVKGFKLDLSYVGTDQNKQLEAFYTAAPVANQEDNFKDLIDGALVFTVSRTF